MSDRNKRDKKDDTPPCRTIFVRNVQFDTTDEQVRDVFEKFGDLKTVFSLIHKRGLCFITFYDIRAAEMAMIGLQDLEFGGRRADLHYSLPKEGDQEKNQGSIDVELIQCSDPLNENELSEYMTQYGEIRLIRSVPHSNQYTFLIRKKIVSFWDSRACQRAIEQVPKNSRFGNGKLTVSMGWDEGQQPLESIARERERVRDRSNERNRNDRRGRDRDRSRERSPPRRRYDREDRRDRDRSPPRRRDSRDDRRNRNESRQQPNYLEMFQGGYPPMPAMGMAPMLQPPMNQPNVLANLLAGLSPNMSGQDRNQQPQQMQQLLGLLSQMGAGQMQQQPQGLGLQMPMQMPNFQGVSGMQQTGSMQQPSSSMGMQQPNMQGMQQPNMQPNMQMQQPGMNRDPRQTQQPASPSRNTNQNQNSQAQLQALAALLLQNKPQ